MQALFKSTIQALKKHDGFIEVIEELNEELYDQEEVGQMYLCESMGETFHVFDDELSFINI
jgi:hypothetical protein